MINTLAYSKESGIKLFNSGRHKEALEHFEFVTLNGTPDALALSYYGLCVSIVEKKHEQGASICIMALKNDSRNPDIYYNLGKSLILNGQKAFAWRVLHKGLKYSPVHTQIRKELAKLGARRNPIIPFLPRTSPINKYLGKLSYYIQLRLSLIVQD